MTRFSHFHVATCALVLASGAVSACDAPSSPQPSRKSSPQVSADPAPSSGGSRSVSESLRREHPVELLQLEESAFGPTLGFDGVDVILLTSTGIHRVAPGRAPERIAADLGLQRAIAGKRVLHWSEGALWATPLRGGKKSKLVDIPFEPHGIAASSDRLVWIDRDVRGVFSVRTVSGGRAKSLYASPGTLVALTSIDGWAFFVERASVDSWRLGGVSLDGGAPQWSALRRGRAPSMLGSAGDLYFYDGPSRSVRRARPDFTFEEAVLEKLVCSPLAVTTSRVVCAQVGGIFEIPLKEPHLLPLTTLALGHVAALALNETHVAWLNDSGENRLTLRVLPLSER